MKYKLMPYVYAQAKDCSERGLPMVRALLVEFKGKWIDYQSGKIYEGGYQTIEVGKIPAVILVRDGSLIPHVPLAQRTDEIDWNAIDLKPYQADAKSCTGLLFKPGDKALQVITK